MTAVELHSFFDAAFLLTVGLKNFAIDVEWREQPGSFFDEAQTRLVFLRLWSLTGNIERSIELSLRYYPHDLFFFFPHLIYFLPGISELDTVHRLLHDARFSMSFETSIPIAMTDIYTPFEFLKRIHAQMETTC